nr:MAG TPA: hypothetical protein [Caudoviricetes sp.]
MESKMVVDLKKFRRRSRRQILKNVVLSMFCKIQ